MSSLKVDIFIPQAGSNCSFAVSPSSFPLSHLQLFPSQITDLVTFASLLTLPSPIPPPHHPVMFLLSAPTCGPWVFEERQRWPLKTATAKFIRGHGNECTPLSMSLSRLHILCTQPPNNLSAPTFLHANALVGAPHCTNDPANYVFKVFGSCENSFGLAVEGGGAVGGVEGARGRGVVHGLMAIMTAQAFM